MTARITVALAVVVVAGSTAAAAAAAPARINPSDLRALTQLRQTGHSRVWHPAAHKRTRADLRRLKRGLLLRVHRAQAARHRKIVRRMGVVRGETALKARPQARAAWHGIALTTNIGCYVGMSMIDNVENYAFASFGVKAFRIEPICPDSSRNFGTVEDIGMSMSDEGYINPYVICQNIAFVAGNDLYYTTGWTGQGVTTVLSMCLNGDYGPIRFGWGGPDQTFAERAAPEVSSLANDYLGWTG